MYARKVTTIKADDVCKKKFKEVSIIILNTLLPFTKENIYCSIIKGISIYAQNIPI